MPPSTTVLEECSGPHLLSPSPTPRYRAHRPCPGRRMTGRSNPLETGIAAHHSRGCGRRIAVCRLRTRSPWRARWRQARHQRERRRCAAGVPSRALEHRSHGYRAGIESQPIGLAAWMRSRTKRFIPPAAGAGSRGSGTAERGGRGTARRLFPNWSRGAWPRTPWER